ncbi:MAG: ectonucleotide pyrophosphatase/phosphodiesterase [Eubacteriales bacterium]|nr:ectonucleotide pyrophosphatase/phosphodiesterase [Eubacteriales bacterium]MDD4444865.1 ectonucleotide pyrophosphatase/phosphodiesterase [Eubacteriales bacterium]
MKSRNTRNRSEGVGPLILLSYDAFSQDHWEEAAVLPNMARLIREGAHCTNLRSVYPTLTYAVHTTMVTGVSPGKHGIVHNNPLQPFVPEALQDWYWYRDAIRVPTLYDAAQDAGLITAGILWPVTGKASITYNLPEVKAVRGENQILKVLRNGSPFFCLDMAWRFGRVRNGHGQPELDDFSTLCAVDTICRKRPDLLLLHLIELDDAKHAHGIAGPQIRQAILRMDRRIGQILDALEQAGLRDTATVMILGDHGQLDIHKKVRLNNLLVRAGLLDPRKEQRFWRAYCQSTKGSAYLHVQPGDAEAEKTALEVLSQAAEEPSFGIEKIYGPDEVDVLAEEGTARYWIECIKGYGVSESIGSPDVIDLDARGETYAAHGYGPDKEGYRCCFLMAGPSIRRAYEISSMEMTDIAPIAANVLGLKMSGLEGRIPEGIFRERG